MVTDLNLNEIRQALREMEPVHGDRPLITLSITEWLVILDGIAEKRQQANADIMAAMNSMNQQMAQQLGVQSGRFTPSSIASAYGPPSGQNAASAEPVFNLETEARMDRFLRNALLATALGCLLWAIGGAL